MSLSFTRLLYRNNLELHKFRGLYTSYPLAVSTTKIISTANQTIEESHDERNMRLKRPLSPHLTIYQLQLTSMLSLSHRASGIILSTYAISLGLGTLLFPGGIICVISAVKHLYIPSAAFFVAKFLLALPVTFHYANGIRHLAWDLGKFLTIKEVYTTGYAVLGLTIAGALALAAL